MQALIGVDQANLPAMEGHGLGADDLWCHPSLAVTHSGADAGARCGLGLNIATFDAGVLVGSMFGATALERWGPAQLDLGRAGRRGAGRYRIAVAAGACRPCSLMPACHLINEHC